MAEEIRQRHLVQLDSVRACAALVVLVYHGGPFGGRPFYGNLGNYGVALFFVLSGFLITGILLSARGAAERSGSTMGGVLRAFYARRSLRIFPLYYFILAVLLVLGVRDIRHTILWHATYLSNILSARRGIFLFPAHFWSLTVEEQFYLVWAPMVLFLPRRWLLRTALAMIAVGPLSRLVLYAIWQRPVTATVVLTSCLDLLGLGCLLALLWHKGSVREPLRDRLGRYALTAGLALGTLETALALLDRGYKVRVVVYSLPAALVGFWLVDRAARGFTGTMGRVLEWAPLVYLGRVSYGIYMYHMFVPMAFSSLGLPFPFESGPARILATLVVTVLVAALSWHLFEKRMNDLKVCFPYVKKRGQGESLADSSKTPVALPTRGDVLA